MLLMPLVFDDLYTTRPTRLLDQHFGVGLNLDDLLSPIDYELPRLPLIHRKPRSISGLLKPSDTVSVDEKNNNYEVHLDVRQFRPDDITVKRTNKNTITVEARHEEREDEHGFIYRHFVRKYIIPEDHDMDGVVCTLSSDGILNITVPDVIKDADSGKIRTIPIQQTGLPMKAKDRLKAKKLRKRRFHS